MYYIMTIMIDMMTPILEVKSTRKSLPTDFTSSIEIGSSPSDYDCNDSYDKL